MLWFISNLDFVHEYVAQYRTQMFYKVVAVKNYTREQVEYLEELNNSREKISWKEVLMVLVSIACGVIGVLYYKFLWEL